MPIFGRSSKAPVSEWNDVDHFDVDVLADFLLDDGGSTSGGISFDFA